MMKAWIVENTSKEWNEIIFADNYKEAKKKATYTDLCEYRNDFVNLRVKRYPKMDDTENLSHMVYTYKLWQSGWVWECDYPLETYDNYSDKRKARIGFLKWYNWYYKGSESNENN